MSYGLEGIARQHIRQETLSIARVRSETVESTGYTTIAYAPAVTAIGSLQPLGADQVTKIAMTLGVSIHKRYAKLYTETDLSISPPDRVTVGGITYEPIALRDWSYQDSWYCYTLVECADDR